MKRASIAVKHTLTLLTPLLLAPLAALPAAALPKAVCRAEADARLAQLPSLSWDPEGGNRTQLHLLRAPVELRLPSPEGWVASRELPARSVPMANGGARYHVDLRQVHSNDSGGLAWGIVPGANRFIMTMPSKQRLPEVEMVFPFKMRVALMTASASRWTMDGTLRLPAVVSAPAFGQMLLSRFDGGSSGNPRVVVSAAAAP